MAKLTRVQLDVLAKIGRTPEAIERKPYFEGCDGKTVGMVDTVERLAKARVVAIEVVGQSRFVTITDTGRSTLGLAPLPAPPPSCQDSGKD